MIFSKSVEYAIKALSYMAQKDATAYFGVMELSSRLEVSRTYLAKILQTLVRKGILKSTTGPNGGFKFSKKPGDINLLSVVLLFDGNVAFERCFMGWAECGDNNPCPMHPNIKEFKQKLRIDLEKMTVEKASTIAWPLFTRKDR